MTNASHAAIVVIESHPEHRDYITTLLRRAGYSVAGYATAAKALRHIANDPTSLIITDVFMPELDGFEVLRELKRSHLDLPVIAVTGGDPRHAHFSTRCVIWAPAPASPSRSMRGRSSMR